MSGKWEMLKHTPMRDVLRGRLTGRLDWRGMIAESGLPEEVQQALRFTVKKTRLNKLEKGAVAQELVAHFQDAQVGGKTAQETLACFGDVKCAAKLIRRGQLRKRSWTLKVRRLAWQGTGVLLMVYVVFCIWIHLGSEVVVKTDYLAQINAAAMAVPEEDRAWPVVREAMTRMGYAHHEEHDANQPRTADHIADDFVDGTPWYKQNAWLEMETWLVSHTEDITRLREAVKKPGWGLPHSEPIDGYALEDAMFFYGPNPEVEHETEMEEWLEGSAFFRWVPNLMTIRSAARCLVWECLRCVRRGDEPGARENLKALFDLAEHATEGDKAPFIAYLVKYSIYGLGHGAVEDAIVFGLNEPRLWQALLEKQTIAPMNYEGERAMFMDLVQRVFTDDGSGRGRAHPERMIRLVDWLDGADDYWLWESAHEWEDVVWAMMVNSKASHLALGPAFSLDMASRQETEQLANSLFDRLNETVGQSYLSSLKNSSGIDNEIEDLSSRGFSKMRYALITATMPALGAAPRITGERQLLQEALCMRLALHAYQQHHGRMPEKAEHLVPNWLQTLPLDPHTEKPLCYVQTEDGVLVYSVGQNGVDDGGIDGGRSAGYFFDSTDGVEEGDWWLSPRSNQ